MLHAGEMCKYHPSAPRFSASGVGLSQPRAARALISPVAAGLGQEAVPALWFSGAIGLWGEVNPGQSTFRSCPCCLGQARSNHLTPVCLSFLFLK